MDKKFVLEESYRRFTDQDLIDDLLRVALELNKKSLSHFEYRERGKYKAHNFVQRFGSWIKALEKAGLGKSKSKIQRVTDQYLIADLLRVALELNKKSLSYSEYQDRGKHPPSTFARRFGSWSHALKKAGLEQISHPKQFTEEELFQNLEKIWVGLGRQPRYEEVKKPLSKFSNGTYAKRFGNWRNALEKFVAFINEEEGVSLDNIAESIEVKSAKEPEAKQEIDEKAAIGTANSTADIEVRPAKGPKTKRGINWRLRFIVMKRDNFKCRYCGRSPATNPKIILHVDHIKAWANDGKTVLENLQTLCSKCNIGKSNLE